MRLAILDASAIGGGPVSRAIEAAAREAAGPDDRVASVRLFDVFASCCASCTACSPTGRCTSRLSRIADIGDALSSADSLILGVPSHLHARDPRSLALLRRMVGAFSGVGMVRATDDHPDTEGHPLKAAVLISSAPPLMGALAQLGLMPSGLSALWQILDRAHIDVVATTSVSARFSGPASWDRARVRGRAVGRMLAAARPPDYAVVAIPVSAPTRAATVLAQVRARSA